MATKQILFRLEETSAKALENKLTEKGISKQFLFSKVVDMFINNELSFNNNLITSSDNKQITIDSSEVAETIKKYYLDDLANLIASDNNLIALVTEKLESNVLDKLEAIDSKNYQFDNKSNDNNVIANDIQKPRIVETETAELEEIEEKAVIIPKTENKPLIDDSHGAKTYEDSKAKIKELNLKGKSNGEIARFLNNELYPTFKGNTGKWRSNQVKSILK